MTRLALPLCLAEVLTMLGVFTFPALLPAFMDDWALSNTQAGWISGVYYAAYAVAAPLLISLTDRVDAKWVYAGGALLAALSAAGFALAADGFWTAMLFRALGGAALAGTYMPGLRILVDRLDVRVGPQGRARAVPLYTASFSLGTAISYYAAGLLGDAIGWRGAFAVAALAALGAAAVALAQGRQPPEPPAAGTRTRLLDFRPVLRNRPAMGYVLGYAAHMWELFAFRSWVVAFLAAVAVTAGGTGGWPEPATVATLGALVAMAASIGGAAVATRLGRAGTVAVYMTLSGVLGLGIGGLDGLAYGLVAMVTLLYAGLIQLDSAALTTGAVETAESGRRGATLAVHSLVGFLAGFLGPLAMGMVLDAAPEGWNWGLGFASAALVGLLGVPAILWGARKLSLDKAARP